MKYEIIGSDGFVTIEYMDALVGIDCSGTFTLLSNIAETDLNVFFFVRMIK